MQVMIIYFVLQSLLADLVEAMKLIEVNAIAVGHDHAMEDDGHAALLAEACRADLPGFAEHDSSVGNDHVLMVVGIDRV